MTSRAVQPRRLHERLLLAAADAQGDTPIGPVPLHSETELDPFVQAAGIDRMALIGAFTEVERRGWIELIKVMGPWHWQVTYRGLELADRLRAEDSATLVEVKAADRASGADAAIRVEVAASGTVNDSATPVEPEAEPARAAEFGWDLFLAHAGEDKGTFADDLAKELDAIGLAVWYDDFEMVIGDSLRGRIDDGLARSEFGIVLLSPSFFAKSWPQTELDGLAAKERNGAQVILPVWHELDHEGVAGFSPMLAGRMGVRSSEGAAAVAEKLKRAIYRHRMRRIPKGPA